jgi:DNA polymerase
MTTLHIDFETRSVVDLRKAGVYVYAEHESTDVWCAAYAVDDGPVHLWTPNELCPVGAMAAAYADWTIVAHNANFERAIWREVLHKRYGWPEPRLEQWRCTMAMALAQALPGSLDNCAAALGLAHRKDQEGYSTIGCGRCDLMSRSCGGWINVSTTAAFTSTTSWRKGH